MLTGGQSLLISVCAHDRHDGITFNNNSNKLTECCACFLDGKESTF